MGTSNAILIAASLATVGWWYTARRARSLSRKQHTINVIMQTQYSELYRKKFSEIIPFLTKGKCPDLTNNRNSKHRPAFSLVLNHYEFVAVGIRNGDFDEKLFKDSERGTILQLYCSCKDVIYKIRDKRERQSTYEHLEWLGRRWGKKLPWYQKLLEWFLMRPTQGHRHDPH